MIDLTVDLGFLKLKNPVIAASGTFGYGLEFQPFLDLERLGGFVVKGLYPDPRPGNPPPRLAETPAGLLNAIGLQGIGVENFCREILPQLRDLDTAVIVNVCGGHEDEYLRVVDRLNREDGVAAYELNISCPNVRAQGLCPAQDPAATRRIVERIKSGSRRPVIAKLSPNVTDITAVALGAEEGGADAVSLINTFLALAVDVQTRRPRLANIYGGLSGPAIKPIALRMVHQTAARLKIPVIGLGGILSAEDALEFLIAGARAVQVGTANLIDPRATLEVIEGIAAYGDAHGIGRIETLVGTLKIDGKE
jgi:dihydroorotate dehydrogenase (NAD+) catalytic subunit